MRSFLVCFVVCCFLSLSLGASNDVTKQWVVTEYYKSKPCEYASIVDVLAYRVGYCRSQSSYSAIYKFSNGVLNYYYCTDTQCQNCPYGSNVLEQCVKEGNKRDTSISTHSQDLMVKRQGMIKDNHKKERSVSDIDDWNFSSTYISNGLPEYAATSLVYLSFAKNHTCDYNYVDFLSIDKDCDLQSECSATNNYLFTCGFPNFTPSSSGSVSTTSSAPSAPIIFKINIILVIEGDFTLVNSTAFNVGFQAILSTNTITIKITPLNRKRASSFQLEADATVVLPPSSPTSVVSLYSSSALTASISDAFENADSDLAAAAVGFNVTSVKATSSTGQSSGGGSGGGSSIPDKDSSASFIIFSSSVAMLLLAIVLF